jgi:excisionase family DNA binding protein
MKLYTLTNAAQKLNVCTRTVRRWSEAGHIKLIHVGLKVCISSDELERVMVEGVPAYSVSDEHRAKMRENAKLGRAGLAKKRARAEARAADTRTKSDLPARQLDGHSAGGG